MFVDAAESLLQLFEGVYPDTCEGRTEVGVEIKSELLSHITVILRQDRSENITVVVEKGCFRFY